MTQTLPPKLQAMVDELSSPSTILADKYEVLL